MLKENIGANFSVANLDKKPAKKSPAAPFTTSTLQQEASQEKCIFLFQGPCKWHNAYTRRG